MIIIIRQRLPPPCAFPRFSVRNKLEWQEGYDGNEYRSRTESDGKKKKQRNAASLLSPPLSL